ncbi:MAG: serine hydrolase domain-containing protein [Alphaproteobacteria bacterium]
MAMTSRRTILTGAAALAMAPRAWAQTRTLYWPTATDWATNDPKAAGFDPARLDAAVKATIADNSTSCLVLRDGKIISEAYGTGGGRGVLREIASAGKSMVSTLTGCCLDEGKIKSLDQSAADFFPQWKGTPKEAITVKHLISMTSGLDDNGLAVRNVMGDQEAINAAARQLNPPGTQWHYNTPVYHLMFHLVARAAGEPFEVYAKRKLLDPLGMKETTWLTNKGHDATGKEVTNYYTANCSARDLARFGMMALGGGAFDGRRVVSATYLKAATSPSQTLNGSYGYLWWENAKPGRAAAAGAATAPPRYLFSGAPADTFAALGALGQNVVVLPTQGIVIVRQGGAAAAGGPANVAQMTAAVVAAMDAPPEVVRNQGPEPVSRPAG